MIIRTTFACTHTNIIQKMPPFFKYNKCTVFSNIQKEELLTQPASAKEKKKTDYLP